MYFKIGLFPSKAWAQLTFTLRWSMRSALTKVGAYGNSITFNLAERVSFPPGETREQVYSPTSAFLTACISRVPSLVTLIRWRLKFTELEPEINWKHVQHYLIQTTNEPDYLLNFKNFTKPIKIFKWQDFFLLL